MKPQRIEVLGVPVDCVDMRQAIDYVQAMMDNDRPQTVIANNPEKIMKARQDTSLLRQLLTSGLVIPDGIGVVVAARLLASARIERVPGSELMPALCSLAAKKGYSIYLFGANNDVNQRAREILSKRYPGLRIAGNHHGYVAEEKMFSVIDDINDSGADILFVALGSPRQERWMDEHLVKTNVKVCQGVGGTFDVIAGEVKRAPWLFRAINLEWFYRLVTNPRRIYRQTALPKFVFAVAKEKFLSCRAKAT